MSFDGTLTTIYEGEDAISPETRIEAPRAEDGAKGGGIGKGAVLSAEKATQASGAIADLDALLRSQAEPTNGPRPAAPSWALRCPVGRSPATPEYSKEDKREEQRSKNTSQNISKIKRRKQSSKLGKHKIGPTVAPRRVILSPPGIQG